MKPNQYENFIRNLEGLEAWGAKTSIGGMTIQFGSALKTEPPFERGEWTVWIQTRMRVAAARKLVLDTDYPLVEHAAVVSQYLLGKKVTQAAIDESNNSLRLLFYRDILLSVFPGTSKDDLPWTLFDNRGAPNVTLIAYSDVFEGKMA
jgi:hypothetical protein